MMGSLFPKTQTSQDARLVRRNLYVAPTKNGAMTRQEANERLFQKMEAAARERRRQANLARQERSRAIAVSEARSLATTPEHHHHEFPVMRITRDEMVRWIGMAAATPSAAGTFWTETDWAIAEQVMGTRAPPTLVIREGDARCPGVQGLYQTTCCDSRAGLDCHRLHAHTITIAPGLDPARRQWVLRHELAHGVIHEFKHLERVPVLVDYLEEGLAELLALATTLQNGGDALAFLDGYHVRTLTRFMTSADLGEGALTRTVDEGNHIKYVEAPYALLRMWLNGGNEVTLDAFVRRILRERRIAI